MELSPADPKLFCAAIDALKEYLPQAQLCISTEGLRIRGMDVSHVGFVDYFLAAEDCATLTVASPVTLGVNLGVLARVLSSVGDAAVTLSQKKEMFVISYSNAKAAKKAVYEISTLDIDMDSLELPTDLTYAANVCAKTADVLSVVKEVGQFGEAMTLCLDGDGFHLSATGDFGSAKQTLENTEGRDMELTEDSVTVRFGAKYVMGILKGGAALSPNLQMEFDTTQPMRASFRFGHGSHFVAYLAPKVSDD
jgi:proliferating cell nuclear antigen PCNA